MALNKRGFKQFVSKNDELNRIQQAVAEALRNLNGGSDGMDATVPESTVRVGSAIIEHTFTTLDPVESTFPLAITLPAGPLPAGVKVVGVDNLTDPDALFYEAVDIPHWSCAYLGGASSSNAVRFIQQGSIPAMGVPYITGLAPLTEYTLTIELLYA